MLKIADIMTSDVFTLPASCRADQAAWELSVRGYTGAPVRDDSGRLVGVLSRSDLADPERNEGPLEGRDVQELMTPGIFTLRAEDLVMNAVKLMVREGIHRVVVTDGDRKLVGIVTSSDVLHALMRGQLGEDAFDSAAFGDRASRAPSPA